MKIRSVLLIVLVLCVGGLAQAGTKKKLKSGASPAAKSAAKAPAKAKAKPSPKSAALKSAGTGAKLQREVVFDGSTVGGQYHSAGEAVTKVEQEKKMNDLIGMRRDYKDRMAADKERLKRGDESSAN